LYENGRGKGHRLISFVILMAALILQALPFNLETHTLFNSHGVMKEIIDTYSYFNIQQNVYYFYVPLLTSAATIFAAVCMMLGLLSKKRGKTYWLDTSSLLISSVAAIVTAVLARTVLSACVAGLLILAATLYIIQNNMK